MPIYEFQCQSCGGEFEFLQRGDEQPTCPECGGAQLSRHLSLPAAHVASGSLPIAGQDWQGCGRPACRMGGCQGLG